MVIEIAEGGRTAIAAEIGDDQDRGRDEEGVQVVTADLVLVRIRVLDHGRALILGNEKAGSRLRVVSLGRVLDVVDSPTNRLRFL